MSDQPHVETTPEQEAIPEEAMVLIGEVQTEEEQQQGEQEPEYSPQMAAMEAGFLVDMAADTVEGAHPAIEYEKGTREQVAERLAPVLAKHGGKMPPWLEQWKEEIMLVITLGSVAYGTVKAVREYEAEQQEKGKRQGKKGEADGQA